MIYCMADDWGVASDCKGRFSFVHSLYSCMTPQSATTKHIPWTFYVKDFKCVFCRCPWRKHTWHVCLSVVLLRLETVNSIWMWGCDGQTCNDQLVYNERGCICEILQQILGFTSSEAPGGSRSLNAHRRAASPREREEEREEGRRRDREKGERQRGESVFPETELWLDTTVGSA